MYNLFPIFKLWHFILLLANTHDRQNRFQKLNEIHRRRFSRWNCHTDSLTFVARSHHWHQSLTMINNATNDSLANWIVLWTLTYPVLLVKALRLLIQSQNGRWVQLSLHFLSLRWMYERQEIILFDNKAPIQIWIWWWRIVIKTAEAKNNIMISFHGSRDRASVLVKPRSTQVVWKGTQHTHHYGAVWM